MCSSDLSVKASWVAKENLHLTLKFLGETKLKQAEKIKEKIKGCLQNETSLKCMLNKIGALPKEKLARVIWAGVENEDNQIAELAKKIENSVFELGFKKEKRDFKNHVTICRPRRILNPDQFSLLIEKINKDFKPYEFIIDKLTFFESRLTPQGSIYTPLLSCPL